MENDKFKDLSMEEQLALLDEERDKTSYNIEEEPIDISESGGSDEPTITERETKKLPKSKRIILGFISILILIVGIVIYVNTISKSPEDNNSSGDKVSQKQPTNNEIIENRIDVPSDIKSNEEFVSMISMVNGVTHNYLQEIREIIINYIDRDRNDIYIETELEIYKKSLLSDIERFAKYKTIYDEFQAADLYVATADRLRNAYDLTRTTKNVMSEKALIANTNSFIDKEQEINTRVKVALMSYMDNNDIEFDQLDDKIVYKIDNKN